MPRRAVFSRGVTFVALGISALGFTSSLWPAQAADLSGRHRHHHPHRIVVDVEPAVVPLGYAYGGYGNGIGPGWERNGYGPGYGPGYAPGYGYIPSDAPSYGLGY